MYVFHGSVLLCNLELMIHSYPHFRVRKTWGRLSSVGHVWRGVKGQFVLIHHGAYGMNTDKRALWVQSKHYLVNNGRTCKEASVHIASKGDNSQPVQFGSQSLSEPIGCVHLSTAFLPRELSYFPFRVFRTFLNCRTK